MPDITFITGNLFEERGFYFRDEEWRQAEAAAEAHAAAEDRGEAPRVLGFGEKLKLDRQQTAALNIYRRFAEGERKNWPELLPVIKFDVDELLQDVGASPQLPCCGLG